MPDEVRWVRAHEDQLCTCTDIRSMHTPACSGRNAGGTPCTCKAFRLATDQG